MMNQSSGRYTFPKAEHLCGEIRINQLFAEGKAFIVAGFLDVVEQLDAIRPEVVESGFTTVNF